MGFVDEEQHAADYYQPGGSAQDRIMNSGPLRSAKLKASIERKIRVRRFGMIAIALFGFCLVLVIAGATYQSWANQRDARSYAAPGKLLRVGTHRLHLHCMGEGKPAVIFDAGAGGTSLDWQEIQTRLAQRARVCAYDRAGLGWSDPGPLPRTSGQMVEELRILLRGANVEPPYILVGHSFGGLNVQLFAARYPQDVVGIVLADSVHPEFYARMPDNLHRAVRKQLARLRVAGMLAPLGVPRLFFPPVATRGLPREIQRAADALGYRSSVYSTVYEEAQAFDASAEQVRAAPRLSQSLFLTVLTRSKPETWPDGVSADHAEATWVELQADLAAQVPDSTHIVVENAGHFIHLDRPDAVIKAIESQISSAKRSAGRVQ